MPISTLQAGRAPDAPNLPQAPRPLEGPPADAALPADARHAWLVWQCQMITGTLHGEIFEVAREGKRLRSREIWPAEDTASTELLQVAARALFERNTIKERATRTEAPDLPNGDFLAQPILIDNEVRAVVALHLKSRSDLQLRAVMQLLQWGVLWFETLLRDRDTADKPVGALSVSLLETTLDAPDAATAAAAICQTLGNYFGFERVSFGVREGLRTRLLGTTPGVSLARNSALQQDLEAAMTEACDLRSIITYPLPTLPAPCHQALLRRQGMRALCTLPLLRGTQCFGAVTLERLNGDPIPAPLLAEIAALTPVLGRHLQLLRQRDRALGTLLHRVWTSLRNARALLACALAALLALGVIEGPYRLPGNATIQGTVQRTIVAPLDGYVAEAHVRAGDVVAAGALLARLEDRDLAIEREKWRSEQERHAKEYSQALALHERARAGIARAQLEQTRAELALVEERLERTQLRAPFAGIVVSGDLSQQLGTAVSRGQTLFEVAPLKHYQVVTDIDERDIGEIALAQRGTLRLAGMPNRGLAITVTRIAPVAVADDGHTFFRVEASLDAPDATIRPGMQGVAKFEAGTRPLWWVWGHELLSKLRLWFWSWGV